MKTNQFLALLEAHPNKSLLFEYQLGQFVPKAYHITEIKNVYIESVDCGGRASSERRTVVQLWHDGKEQGDYMTGSKAKGIFDIVNKIKPLLPETTIYFEYGSETMNTSHFEVQQTLEEDDRIVMQLYVQPPVCKPAFELEMACGPGAGSGCC